jgi:glycosyltransferase involved in cell wall biosynthesis
MADRLQGLGVSGRGRSQGRSRPLRILQVGTSDFGGGAERSAWNLFHAFSDLGHESWLVVGHKRSSEDHVWEIPNDANRNGWVRWWDGVRRQQDSATGRIRGLGRLSRQMIAIGEPVRSIERYLGIEDFNFPGTRHLLGLTPAKPDVIHLHNLHGNYFDLRVLPQLTRNLPAVLNVHDAWLTTGHCAFSFDCERWTSGCGKCPDLSIYPGIPRDSTAYNWHRKKEILQASRVYVTTPSQWMMSYVKRSIVAPAIVGGRVIPNGVDTAVFRPGERTVARAQLGLDQNAHILTIAAAGIRSNVWKDYKTLKGAIAALGSGVRDRNVLVLALGETAAPETINGVRMVFVPMIRDDEVLAQYYRACDLYVHAARIESFGTVLLEARACGVPFVATAVGGIPEHVRALRWPNRAPISQTFELSEADGILTPPGDGQALADAIGWLLANPEQRFWLGMNGSRRVRDEFSVGRQAERFLAWYDEIISTARQTPMAGAVESGAAARQ